MYSETELVRIAKRENNKKRSYLVVNPLQGKHIPVKPKEALAMFQALAESFREAYTGERLLLIGFAETATAIGAAVAVALNGKYIQTTREQIPDVEYLFFSEEHSHATEQKLVKEDIDRAMQEVDRIVFIEDEVTTGNTIWNIISIMKKCYPNRVEFSVASILNGMDEAALEKYRERNIRLHYLVKTDHTGYGQVAETVTGDGTYSSWDGDGKAVAEELEISGLVNTRRLTDGKTYEEACQQLWNKIKSSFEVSEQQRILVVGTEEFMYPALFVGNKLQEQGAEVWSHSTTRSPIETSCEKAYPVHARYQLKSLYDRERVTFLYDIKSYDKVLIITDAPGYETQGVQSLVQALGTQNQWITLVRWCGK